MGSKVDALRKPQLCRKSHEGQVEALPRVVDSMEAASHGVTVVYLPSDFSHSSAQLHSH
jgi:hypothetical protein